MDKKLVLGVDVHSRQYTKSSRAADESTFILQQSGESGCSVHIRCLRVLFGRGHY